MVDVAAEAARAVPLQVSAAGGNRYTVRGSLNFATARRACDTGLRAFAAAADHAPLELDCSGIGSVDSAGLAVLIAWAAWAQRQGRRIQFSHLPEALLALARISEAEGLLQAPSVGGS